jgi:TldD protein
VSAASGFGDASVSSSRSGSASASEDPVLQAMIDEIGRSMKDLHVDQHKPPYFISYEVKDVDEVVYSSCLGSKPITNRSHDRIFTPIVKVGDYDLDSGYHLSTHWDTSYPLPIDDNYAALRRALWLATDHEYKGAVRVLEWKKAYLSSNNVQDRLPDMSREEPVVSLNSTEPLITSVAWLDNIQRLSELFKNYPSLQKSKVSFINRTINRWYVNSEGSRVRDSNSKVSVRITASAQAEDGMPIVDYDIFARTNESQLPKYEQLKSATEDLAQRVSNLRNAPKGEEYCGPVLFEDQAAAQIFSQVMATNFCLAEEYIGTEDWRNPLKNAIGRKILPKQISVIDDPQAKDADGNLLYGTYKFDDEGLPGKKLTLVDNGVLKGFCQSRLPTRKNAHSNGHSVGGHGEFSILEVASSQPASPEQIRSQLVDLAKDAGLDYVLVVSRMTDDYQMQEYPSGQHRDKRPYVTPSYSQQPGYPQLVYKLYPADGRRELVRGLEFRTMSLRAFRDIQAVGNDAKAQIIEPADSNARALVIPSFVIGELELTPVTPDHSTPPILPGPLASEKTK